ncbi:16S rRNA pseudouridine(516) synthase RsuA [Vibrio tapetis subsp. quintayensis]|uniref:16S rRNA pseudouridine(516) synthase RsuA n=1 Tax=Vibrio tapetis TaxID=52443 RepID=UPI0025B40D66|nr:16S rRNA pseudouridine(516) synthase RsuA [Vibrio tapetis]MDN3682469.1 16S rRNA pseudouridine(516) synthase RsuA [Vibrio tapetis subsp. quintayensis]
MRLDKFLCDSLGATRREATRIIKSGDVTVNGEKKKSGSFQVTDECEVQWQERVIAKQGPKFIMLFKPDGFVCSHEDGSNPTAFTLLDEVKMENLHFAGRLDVDTTGLVLITDDGKWSHRITSPKHKCEKTYRVWLADPVKPEYVDQFLQGIELRSEKEPTLPAHLEVIDDHQVLLTIHEGKYHQVKRMFAALGNKVEELHRERIGAIELDESLEPGEYRYLTQEEIDSVWKK